MTSRRTLNVVFVLTLAAAMWLILTGLVLAAAPIQVTPTVFSNSRADMSLQVVTPPVLTITKTSNVSTVLPGDSFTYTIVVKNITDPLADTALGVAVSDTVPANTTYVPGSAQMTVPRQIMRVTEYYIPVGQFTGTSYDLVLDQALAPDYFVIIEGSDGNGTGTGDRGPDENYVALTQDPFGTGDLGTSASAQILRLSRGNAVNPWVGVVKVVETLADQTGSGFTLLDVRRVDHLGTAVNGSTSANTAWGNINQTMLIGGFNGAGCNTAETSVANTKVCHVRIFPSGSDTINWTRDSGGATLNSATSTVMVVEWGTAWSVQRVRVQGNNGGNGADLASEYNTTVLTNSVTKANTWVWGSGHTNDNGIGDAAEGVLITLGDGSSTSGDNLTENSVAVGLEYAGNGVDFEVYALTHPDLAVDHRYKADGNTNDLTVDVPVDQVAITADRMALVYNGSNGTGNAYPRPINSARYIADETDLVRLERRRSGQPYPAWVQAIDFSGVANSLVTLAAGTPPALLNAGLYNLKQNQAMTFTFAVTVNPATPGDTLITNTATAKASNTSLVTATEVVTVLWLVAVGGQTRFIDAPGSVAAQFWRPVAALPSAGLAGLALVVGALVLGVVIWGYRRR